MDDQLSNLVCPQCGHAFALTDVIKKQLAIELRTQLGKEFAAKEEANRQKLEEELTAKIGESKDQELKFLQKQLEENTTRLQAAQENELQLRVEKEKLTQREKELELDVARRIDQERSKLEATLIQEWNIKHELGDAQKDKKITDLMRLLTEAQRKAEVGSQQAQGEILELMLEQKLRELFPLDSIGDVPKGIRGADVIQKVQNREGTECGIILWELKRTKAFSDLWLNKIKDDQRAMGAHMAVIVTETLPTSINRIGMKEGVWIADLNSFEGLSALLRSQLLAVYQAQKIQVGMNEKLESLYEYLLSPQFKTRMEAILEVYNSNRELLEREKKQFQVKWVRQEAINEKLLSTTTHLYASLHNLIGPTAEKIPQLEGESEDSENSQVT